MRIAASTLLFSLLASGVSATGQGNGGTTTETTTTTGSPTGGACSVSYSSVERGNSGKFVEEFVQDPNNACGVSTDVCVPDDDTGSTDFQPGTCQSQTCQGKQKPGIIEGVDDDASNEATIRVTICHRTCSATNPWVRITIDDDAWGGPAASGCGHQLQHNVTEDCNVPAKEAQSGMTADEIWGVGRRVDYLIKNHGTRETLRTNMGWDEAPCNNNGKCRHSAEEKDYWFYWERACPYVRHGACCGSYETGACCGDNPYPNVNTDIKLKKYACLASADCSGTGVPDDCEDNLLTLPSDVDTKYCYTVENAGEVDICGIEMSDPLDASYNPAIGTAGCLPANSGPVWVDTPLYTSVPPGDEERETAVVSGTPVLDGAVPVTDEDDAAIQWDANASIKLKKYACLASASCTGSGIPMDCYDDRLTGRYPTPTKYCYTVQNTGNVELCGIDMSDPLEGANPITDLVNCLPAGSDPEWLPDPLVTNPVANELESEIATVTGTPQYPNAPPVTDTDPAEILLNVATPSPIAEIATPAPRPPPRTPAPAPGPDGCPHDMSGYPDEICTGVSVTKPILGTENNPPPAEILYNIAFAGTAEEPQVTFQVANPFQSTSDVYVEYYEADLDRTCRKDVGVSGCGEIASTITAVCIQRDPTKPPSAVIDVYFNSADSAVFSNINDIPECCYEETAGRENYQSVKYTYVLYCGCPPAETTRHLRGE